MEVKRLAFLHYSYPGIGGTETVSNTLCEVFEEYGISCSFISWKKVARENDCTAREIFYMPDEENINGELNREAIKQYVLDNKVDVIINQGPFWGGWSCTDKPCKVISVMHYAPDFRKVNIANAIDKIFEDPKKSPKEWIVSFIRKLFKSYFVNRDFNAKDLPLLKNIVSFSDAFILLCDAYVEEFRNLYKIDRSCNSIIEAIPNPVKNKCLFSEKSEEKNLLFIGRLTRWDKRVDRLLHVWKEIFPKHIDWHLYIVGDGEERHNLEAMAAKNNLRNIIFTGYQNPCEYFPKCSILCLTSSSEGFPMVILEAACHGIVPIAFDVSKGVEAIVHDGKNGILVQPFSINEYIKKLDKIMNDKEYRLRLSHEAKFHSENFNPENIFQRWKSLFAKL